MIVGKALSNNDLRKRRKRKLWQYHSRANLEKPLRLFIDQLQINMLNSVFFFSDILRDLYHISWILNSFTPILTSSLLRVWVYVIAWIWGEIGVCTSILESYPSNISMKKRKISRKEVGKAFSSESIRIPKDLQMFESGSRKIMEHTRRPLGLAGYTLKRCITNAPIITACNSSL